jgi:hypothetical protein
LHSKMEALQNSHEVQEAIRTSIQLSKRIFKNDVQTSSKSNEAKEEHEIKCMEALQKVASIRTATFGGNS